MKRQAVRHRGPKIEPAYLSAPPRVRTTQPTNAEWRQMRHQERPKGWLSIFRRSA